MPDIARNTTQFPQHVSEEPLRSNIYVLGSAGGGGGRLLVKLLISPLCKANARLFSLVALALLSALAWGSTTATTELLHGSGMQRPRAGTPLPTG